LFRARPDPTPRHLQRRDLGFVDGVGGVDEGVGGVFFRAVGVPRELVGLVVRLPLLDLALGVGGSQLTPSSTRQGVRGATTESQARRFSLLVVNLTVVILKGFGALGERCHAFAQGFEWGEACRAFVGLVEAVKGDGGSISDKISTNGIKAILC
jgi:hypothetical protein